MIYFFVFASTAMKFGHSNDNILHTLPFYDLIGPFLCTIHNLTKMTWIDMLDFEYITLTPVDLKGAI